MQQSPLVSAVVLNYRSPQQAVACVQNLLAQSFAGRMEVVVVENHSEDDSIGVLRNRCLRDPRVRIVESPRNGGFGSGYNLGIRHARGRYVLINNPDKILEPRGVEKFAAKLQGDPSIGILAPKLVHGDGTLRYSARAFPRPLDVVAKRTFLARFFPGRIARYLQTREDPSRERDVDWVVGGCLFMERDFFLSLGGFDDNFFLFFEDTDLCRRCLEGGKRVVYLPDVVASDRKRRLSEGGMLTLLLTRVGRAHIGSGLKYFAKWGVRPPVRTP